MKQKEMDFIVGHVGNSEGSFSKDEGNPNVVTLCLLIVLGSSLKKGRLALMGQILTPLHSPL